MDIEPQLFAGMTYTQIRELANDTCDESMYSLLDAIDDAGYGPYDDISVVATVGEWRDGDLIVVDAVFTVLSGGTKVAKLELRDDGFHVRSVHRDKACAFKVMAQVTGSKWYRLHKGNKEAASIIETANNETRNPSGIRGLKLIIKELNEHIDHSMRIELDEQKVAPFVLRTWKTV